MKKTMLLASLAAVLISGNAMALRANPNVDHRVLVAGQDAGSVRILPIGSTPHPSHPDAPFGFTFCQYLMRWSASPFGPLGNALPCVLNEQSTTTSLGCFFDKENNFSTLVFAGPNPKMGAPASFCAGYDQFKIGYVRDHIELILSELPDPGAIVGFPPPVGGGPFVCGKTGLPLLMGTACYPGFMAIQSITIQDC